MITHTQQERIIIKKYGGKPLIKYGYDGLIRGKPVEVRSQRKDDRFRIQQDVHRDLISKGGCYIFVNRHGRSKKVSAKQVSNIIGSGKWFKDRTYPHKFINKNKIF